MWISRLHCDRRSPKWFLARHPAKNLAAPKPPLDSAPIELANHRSLIADRVCHAAWPTLDACHSTTSLCQCPPTDTVYQGFLDEWRWTYRWQRNRAAVSGYEAKYTPCRGKSRQHFHLSGED